MASIEVLNATQANVEAPVEIQLSLGNPIYRGPEGKPGKDGVIGRDGKSAYEIAVENGFEGIETEWLESLKGADGQIGATGATGPAGQDGATPIKGIDYFTEQDIASFIAQVPAPDLTNYKQILNIVVNNLQKNNSNNNILSQEQQNVFFNLYQKFTQHLVMPDVWINGFHILFYHTTPSTTSDTTMFYLYSLSYPLNKNDYQLVDGLLYYRFDILVNGTQTGLYDGRLGWEECQQKATNIKLASVLNIAGHRSSNVGDAISTLTNLYASKDYVETAIRGAETGLLKRAVVQELPVSDIDDNTIYMVAKTGSTGDIYDEYLYVNSNWEHIGSTDVDLTNYRKAVYLETSQNLDAESIAILNEIYNHIVALNLSYGASTSVLPLFDIFINGERIEYLSKSNTTITFLTNPYQKDSFQTHQYVWTKDSTSLWANGISNMSGDGLLIQSANSVAGAYPNNRIGDNFKYIKDNYVKTTDMPAYLTNSDILAIWNGTNE